MFGRTASPFRTSAFSSLIFVHSLPLPNCDAAIFQRLSFSFTVYHSYRPSASRGPGVGATGSSGTSVSSATGDGTTGGAGAAGAGDAPAVAPGLGGTR